MLGDCMCIRADFLRMSSRVDAGGHLLRPLSFEDELLEFDIGRVGCVAAVEHVSLAVPEYKSLKCLTQIPQPQQPNSVP